MRAHVVALQVYLLREGAKTDDMSVGLLSTVCTLVTLQGACIREGLANPHDDRR